MKRLALLAALILPACAEQAVPPPPEPAAPIADAFLDGLKADYPVTLSPLGDGVWVHTTQHRLPGQAPIPSNGLVVVDGEAVTLVDGAWGELATVALLEAVREETGLPVTRMVITHHHNDRISGVDAAERTGVEVFVHPDTPGLAAQSGQPVPDTSVAALAEPEARVKVGRVEVAYPGPGHASDNITVYVPDSGVLFGGCLVKGAGAKSLGYIADADLPRWRDALLWTKATYPETQTVVPGHGKGANLSLLDATVALIDAKIAEETDAG